MTLVRGGLLWAYPPRHLQDRGGANGTDPPREFLVFFECNFLGRGIVGAGDPAVYFNGVNQR